MRWIAACALLCSLMGPMAAAQVPANALGTPAATADRPLPEIHALLAAVERNQRRFEAAAADYTYHVHVETTQLDGHGGVKRVETRDFDSLAIDGVRVERLQARDGKPLTEDQRRKENERIDKAVARAKEQRARREDRGQATDANGDAVIPLSRILELGSFTHPRREILDGRPTIVADYAGDPKAKTRNEAEKIIRVLTGTVWIDEQDQALVRGEGSFRDDFKIAGGLLLSVRKGLQFDFRSTRVNDEVWLPQAIDGRGHVRALLVESFDGELHWRATEYRRFRVSSTIHGMEQAPQP